MNTINPIRNFIEHMGFESEVLTLDLYPNGSKLAALYNSFIWGFAQALIGHPLVDGGFVPRLVANKLARLLGHKKMCARIYLSACYLAGTPAHIERRHSRNLSN